MFNLEDAYTNITLDDIYSKVSEYELWKYYCSNFEGLEKPFRSDLYNDNNPDCWIYKATNNRLKYKDFGTGDSYGIIEYIQNKYNCTFKECITIISNDFNLAKSKILVTNETKLLNFEENIPKDKARIDILSQSFNLTDFNYWNQYKIPLDLLQEYDVFSCKNVYLIKKEKIVTFTYTKNNPIYAYRFTNEGKYSYKIYFPYAEKKFKWLFSGGSSKDIEGFDQLPLFGDKLILTKSLKDCIVYRILGYNAISLQGETNRLDQELVNKLLKRFDSIIINYDNDTEGIKNTIRLHNQYNFKYFYIDEFKDISDYIKGYGLEKTIELLKIKMEEIDE